MFDLSRSAPTWAAACALLLDAYALVLSGWVRQADATRAAAAALHRQQMACEVLPRPQERRTSLSGMGWWDGCSARAGRTNR